jgi:uncharacterized protein YecT (DUF1311 family)
MRILVSSLGLAGALLALSAVAQPKLPKMMAMPKVPSAGAAESCEPSPSLPGVQCMAEQQKIQDRELNAAYRAALHALPEQDSWDTRRNRENLVKAQRAWRRYRDTHCPVVGAQEGGSNMSITFAMQLCEWNLTDERIKFLKLVAENR